VIAAMSRGTAPHIVRVAQLTSSARPPFDADLVLAPIGSSVGLPLGPAIVRGTSNASTHRQGVIIVSYGNPSLATAIADRLASLSPELLSAGPAIESPVRFVPEVELPDRYAARLAAIVVGAGEQPLAAARALLPRAAGCETFVAGDFPSGPVADLLNLEMVTETTALDYVAHRIDSLERSGTPVSAVDEQFDAGIQAEHLVRDVRALKIATRSTTNDDNKRHDRQ
jgi:hypothetical protein